MSDTAPALHTYAIHCGREFITEVQGTEARVFDGSLIVDDGRDALARIIRGQA